MHFFLQLSFCPTPNGLIVMSFHCSGLIVGVIYPFVPSVDQPLLQCLRAKKKRNLMVHLFNKYSLNIYCVIAEKAMAPHSSTLAWKIPRMEEPGRLQSMGSLGVGHD